MMFPLVRELADDGIPVTVTCRVLKLCRQQYYRWLGQPFTDAELDEAWLANAIFDAHRDDPEFGYRFLADEVCAVGHDVSDRVVWRICRDIGGQAVLLRDQGLVLEPAAHTLNTRPRKILGWRTPAEAFDEHLRSLQQAGVATTG